MYHSHVRSGLVSTQCIINIPTIDIGAGPHCDGQVLVVDEVVGLTEDTAPFSTAFGDVRDEMEQAIDGYVSAVEGGSSRPTSTATMSTR